MTAQDERAAVVAWLRKYGSHLIASQRRALEGAAINIEQGAHLRGDHITPGGD